MSCLSRIRMALEDMTAVERRIAQQVLAAPELVQDATASDLAQASDTSPASVVRFARMLGYETLAEMKEALKGDVESFQEQDVEIVLHTDDGLSEMAQKMVLKVQCALSNTLRIQREKDLQAAIDALVAADSICLFGIGASGLAATDLMLKLVRVGKRCAYYTESDVGLVRATHMTERDVALAFSYGGRTRPVNLAMTAAKQKGAKTIAVTKFGKSPLAQTADIVLPVPENEKELRVGAMNSRYGQLLLVDLLFMGMLRQQGDDLYPSLEETLRLIRQLRE